MSAFSPLTTWVESSPSTTLWGEIHGGGLGDGGRTCWWDWIFGPNLNDANANISVELSTYGFLGIGKANAFISIGCVGNLLYESLDDIKDFGRFPNTTWLESVGTSRIFPLGQSSSLGDGGRFCWWDWFFGPSYFFEVESCNIDVELAAILNIQIPDADTSITFNISGSLLNTNTAVWNPSYRGIDIVLEDNYLTAQAPSSSDHGVRCQQNHITGKYYFEFKQKTLNGNDFAIGLANDSVDNRIVLGGTGSWFWMEDVLYEDGVSSITWTANNGDYTNAIAVDLDAGKCWFYSESAGIWYNSGDPSAGTDPTFIGVSGKIAPIFNGASNLSDIVDVTANFGETTFVHSPPVGFNAWNSAEPLIGTIDITLSVTGTVSIVLYGSSTISFDTLGTFHVPRTLLSNADSLITIDLLAALVIQTVHHVSYTTQVIHQHHTSWETDTGTALSLHEISWSVSAIESHATSYESYVSNSTWNLHETSWLSSGGTSTTVAAHETSWLSSGSTSSMGRIRRTSIALPPRSGCRAALGVASDRRPAATRAASLPAAHRASSRASWGLRIGERYGQHCANLNEYRKRVGCQPDRRAARHPRTQRGLVRASAVGVPEGAAGELRVARVPGGTDRLSRGRPVRRPARHRRGHGRGLFAVRGRRQSSPSSAARRCVAGLRVPAVGSAARHGRRAGGYPAGPHSALDGGRDARVASRVVARAGCRGAGVRRRRGPGPRGPADPRQRATLRRHAAAAGRPA